MFDFSIVTQWIHSMLTSFMPEGLAVFIECVAIGVCIMLACSVRMNRIRYGQFL